MGGSPGVVVMGGDSRSEGRGFESQCHILDIFHINLLKNCIDVCLKKTENKRKRGLGFFKKTIHHIGRS